MDQADEAWLLELAARIDEGRPVDWAQVEAEAGPGALEMVRALRVIEAMAVRGRHHGLAVQSEAVTALPPPDPPSPAQTPAADPPPQDGPHADRYRSAEPSPPEEIRRKLLFGLALVLSLASVLVGLLVNVPILQYTLVGLAVVVVVIALLTGAPPPPPPAASGSPDPGPPA